MKTFFDGPFKNSLFSGKTWKNRTAMVLVPHQDDEINLAGATICNLIDHGIRVYVVFCTTCDRLEPAELRAAEGIRSCRALGVPDQGIHKAPSDGLSGMTDEEKMGVKYRDIGDVIQHRPVSQEAYEAIEKLHRGAAHKFHIPVYERDER